jgi:phospholipid/cholesterol/gamma-HCH transport system substrate-binding protein
VSDYETTQKVRDITVGVFVIIGLCALGWLIFKFGDLPTIVTRLNSFDIYVQFAAAPGVQINTPVQFCGYQVGKVTDVQPPELRDELADGKRTGRRFHQILVTISIDKKYSNIPADSKVRLLTRGLGSSFIQIVAVSNVPVETTDPNKTPFLADKMLLQGSTAIASDYISEETGQKLDQLVTGLDALIKNANDIIGDPNNKRNFADSLANLRKSAEQANQSLKQLESFLASGTKTSEELSKVAVQLTAILDKINQGQGSASRFVNDPKFYESLLENSKQLQILLGEVKKLIDKLNKEGVKLL